MNQKERTIQSKLSYGFADIYGGGSFLIISILYMVFLTDVVKMTPVLAGTIPLIGKIWDAITDPIMGNIADRTQSKFGAKRFYLLIGSVLSGLSFAMLWSTLEGGIMLQYAYYLLMYILFSTAFTIVMVPYNALLPDMIDDYSLRGSYTMYRMIFSAISAIIAGLIPSLIINSFGNHVKQGYLAMGALFGIVFFLSIMVTFFGSWEMSKPVVKKSFYDAFSHSFSVFKNRSFRLYLGIFLFGQGSADFVTGGVIYFLAVVIRRSDYFMAVMASVLLSQLLAMFLYQQVIRNWSKKTPILLGFPLRILATIGLLFFAHENAPLLPIVVLSFIAGIGTAASSVTSYAILADLSDVDQLITTEKRVGIYSGMATFSRKIANGIAIWFTGAILSLFQYNSEALVQKSITVIGVKIMFIAIPIVMMIGTLYFTIKFPIDKGRFEVIQREVRRRQAFDQDLKSTTNFQKEFTQPTDSDRLICEQITGYSYEHLWRLENESI
ncbi:MAG: MFS transporter [Clostridia bacterium]|nr:MFS transporter [Clostridia bacterium]